MTWHWKNRKPTLGEQIMELIKEQGPIGMLDIWRAFPGHNRLRVKQQTEELRIGQKVDQDTCGKFFAVVTMPSDEEKDKRDKRNAAELVRQGFRVRGVG